MIREIDRRSEDEIHLVARRMRQTLVNVLGTERGAALYTMSWLVDRVRWHLAPERTAIVLLSEDGAHHVTGQAIARIEVDEDGREYGYFSTIFVEPESRRRGIATSLITRVEAWFVERKVPKIVYNTATTNAGLITLFENHGFVITLTDGEMVQLQKRLAER